MSIAIMIIQALVAAVPKIVELIKAGRDMKDITLGEVVASSALAKIRAANKAADDFIAKG